MTLMISIKTLKDTYLIDDNLSDKYILPVIKKGQDFIINPLLGKTVYDTIINEIETDNLSDDSKIILNKIEPILAYYVMSEVIYSTAYKLKNQGLEENVDSNRFNELVRISKKYLLDSQHYESLLKDFISPCTKKGTSIYKSGLYIG